MNAEFTTVFDIGTREFHWGWELLIIVASFLCMAIAIVWLGLNKDKISRLKKGLVLIAIFALLVVFSIAGGRQRRELRDYLNTKTCKTVEGEVRNFHQETDKYNTWEIFEVSAIKFGYFEKSSTHAFHEFGVIQPNSYVRICYDSYSHNILKLEIKKP